MRNSHLFIFYILLFSSLSLAGYAVWKIHQTPEKSAGSFPKEQIEALKSINHGDSIRIFELPDQLDFAGERVPLEEGDVLERLEREIYVNAYWESNMILLMKRSAKYLPLIEEKLKENGIPDDFKYLAMAESGLLNVSSPAGAKGYWQILESTGKEYGLEISKDVDERYHFEKSTIAATKYFKKAHTKFQDWTAVAASYNMGQTGFAKRQEEQLNKAYFDLYLNEETSRYLFRILAFKVIFENPGAFGFHLKPQDFYQNPTLKSIQVTQNIPNLAEWAKNQGSNYKHLKLHNPWLRDQNLKVKSGKVYELRLPA
jgi:membrane-bound lytic murein transglycosylase D